MCRNKAKPDSRLMIIRVNLGEKTASMGNLETCIQNLGQNLWKSLLEVGGSEFFACNLFYFQYDTKGRVR